MDDFLYRARPWAITLVLHNWPLILYAAAIPFAALLAYLQPTRRRLLILYGLLVLAVAFEYQKHGMTVAQSTTDYLFSEYANPTARHISQLVLVQTLPVLLHLLGLALLLVSALCRRNRRSAQPVGALGTRIPGAGERVPRPSDPVPPV
jgi:hypothetical protein